jgi:hypothetical protein
MTWLTWRQFRTQAVTVYAAVAALAVALALTGPGLLALLNDDPSASASDITRLQIGLYIAGAVMVCAAPAVIGVFWGAPLITREIEAGTHRLVWNQTVTRTRWLATKLVVVGGTAVAAAALLSLAATWWSAPIDRLADLAEDSGLPARISPLLFDARGIAPVGFAAFAFVLGVTTGALVRRTVPAMAITLAVFTAVQVAVPLWVRPHLVEPSRQTVTVTEQSLTQFGWGGSDGDLRLKVTTPPGAWVHSNETVGPDGKVIGGPVAGGDACAQPENLERVDPAQSIPRCLASLAERGYRQQVVYLPASAFWVLQWTETGIFLSLALLLTGICFRWTRKRLS